MIDSIKSGMIDLSSGIWKNVSNSAKELIRKMIQVDPNMRPTPSEVLADKWFAKCQKKSIILQEVVERLNLRKIIRDN